LNLQSAQPQHQWCWTDIEDQNDAISDIDIQGFPSIVISSNTGQWCFAGTIEPRIDTLFRIVRSSMAGELRLSASEVKSWQALRNL
jgi:hypothetical protein